MLGTAVYLTFWLPLYSCSSVALPSPCTGTKRFQKGYLAYAGAGKNSRGTQLIMAFQDNLYLGGGSPWEVPFAQVFGASSFETLGMYLHRLSWQYARNWRCGTLN